MRIGLIGAGNMASALARGIGEPVLVADVDAAKAQALAAELGGETVASNAELAERSEAVVLCHKPKQLTEVAEQVAGHAKLIVSILAATDTAALEVAYPGVPVYRFIPNIPAEVRQGVLCYVPGRLAQEGPEREILELFGRAGAIIPLDSEPLIEPAMALMSCGPAFMALVYLVLIFIRIILSWIPRIPYNRWLAGFLKFVTDVTDPYLNLFRRILPPVRIGPGALDLSPIVATFVLIIVSSLVANLIRG